MKSFTAETNKEVLTQSDWLTSDRKNNTETWQNANLYNLNENLPHEYEAIIQRRDFYFWYYQEVEKKGHQIIWPKMAHYISNKLKLIKTFPFNIFMNKSMKTYSIKGSETVFNAAFVELKKLFFADQIVIDEDALMWDEDMLYTEQHDWLAPIYNTMNTKDLKRIERIAKGKFLYKFLVNKKVKFKGDIANANERYNYAILTLRPYCIEIYK